MRGARIAVITGASSGLGRAFALETGRLGGIDEIWLIARRRDNLERLAGELPVKGRALSLDLLAEDSFASLKKLLEEERPAIALLVNNAGRGSAVSFEKESLKDMEDMVRLNAEVPMKLTRLCLPYMKRAFGVQRFEEFPPFLQPLPWQRTEGPGHCGYRALSLLDRRYGVYGEGGGVRSSPWPADSQRGGAAGAFR